MKGSELPSVADRRCCSGALSQINEPTLHAFRVEKSKNLNLCSGEAQLFAKREFRCRVISVFTAVVQGISGHDS